MTGETPEVRSDKRRREEREEREEREDKPVVTVQKSNCLMFH